MIKWLFGKGDHDEDHTNRLSMAKDRKQRAEREHQEALELIELLEVEHKKNHYSEMIEAALGNVRGNK